MVSPTTLLIAAAVAVGLSAKDCKVGDQWTAKYIRFECYKGKGGIQGGAIGCVPTNKPNGEVIKPGANFDDEKFVYSCVKSDNLIEYKIIKCRDLKGKAMSVGENRTMHDGAEWRCYKDKEGNIKLARQKEGGCIYNKTVYSVGKKWMKDEPLKVMVKKTPKILGKGVIFSCFKNEKGEFSAKSIGCMTSTGTSLNNNSLDTIELIHIRCKVAANGKVALELVPDKDVACSLNGTIVKSGANYTTRDGVDVYYCKYSVINKIGCLIDGKMYKPNDNAALYFKKKVYRCNSRAGVFDFGKITGCTLPKGAINKFNTMWVNGTEYHRCDYAIDKKEKLTTSITVMGCAYYEKPIGKNTTAPKPKLVGKGKLVVKLPVLKKCDQVSQGRKEKVWAMRDFTKAERAAYIKMLEDAAAKRAADKKKRKNPYEWWGAGSLGSAGLLTREQLKALEQKNKEDKKAKPDNRGADTAPEEPKDEAPEEGTDQDAEEATSEVPEEEAPEEVTMEAQEDNTNEAQDETTPKAVEETTPESGEETTPEAREETTPEATSKKGANYPSPNFK